MLVLCSRHRLSRSKGIVCNMTIVDSYFERRHVVGILATFKIVPLSCFFPICCSIGQCVVSILKGFKAKLQASL